MIGFLIEALVALLLLVTIGYCILLNRRLRRLRSDEDSLRETIAELVHATAIADRAIQGLKETARHCDRDLTDKLERAERYSRTIEAQISQGEKVLGRLARISGVARQYGLTDRPAERASGDAPPPSGSRISGRAA